MIEKATPGSRKFVLTTISLVALAAAPARAQTSDDKPAPAPGTSADLQAVPPAAPPPSATPPTTLPPPSPLPLPPSPPPEPAAPSVGASSPNGIPHPPEVPSAQSADAGWFTRKPLRVQYGEGKQAWAFTVFGTIQTDFITDTTRSYNDFIGQSLVARTDTYEGNHGRTQFGMRNTRVGFLLDSPALGSVIPSAVFQGDFSGNQPSVPFVPPGSPGEAGISENGYYNSPTFRTRHAYLSLKTPVVNVLAGQTFDVFGWQNYYLSNSLLGLPNQTSSRTTQLRLAKTLNADGPAALDIAVSATRPAQRDSMVPDFMGGLRVSFPGWKGIQTPGSATTSLAPMSIGVSGVARQFKVNAFTPPPAQSSNSATGWGVSGDVFIPVIPSTSPADRGNRLSLLGSFVWGTGIADLIVSGGGARFPTLPNPAQQSPPPHYTPNIDHGLVTFDTVGRLYTIDWWAAKGGFQYYFPGSGRVFLSGNLTWAHSRNISKLFPMGGAEIELLGAIVDRSIAADANLTFDVTPAIRVGVAGVYTRMRYLDHTAANPQDPYNIRGIGTAMYSF